MIASLSPSLQISSNLEKAAQLRQFLKAAP
jgi:hypothetical protein